MEFLKFEPLLKQTIWGGDKIIPFKHLEKSLDQVGESWEVSGVKNNEPFTYYFGASWCKSGTPNQRVWYMQIEDFMNNLKQPLQTAVTVK